MMDEQKRLKAVLLTSAGKAVDLCIICTSEDYVCDVQTDLVSRLREKFPEGIANVVQGDAVFIDDMILKGPNQAEHCLDCLRGLCEHHGVRSITIMSDGEPDEFYAAELRAA